MQAAIQAKQQLQASGRETWVGCLYFRPGQELTGNALVDLSREDVRNMHDKRQLINKPVRVEHFRANGDSTAGLFPQGDQTDDVAGAVVDTFLDEDDGSLYCIFEIDQQRPFGPYAKFLLTKGSAKMLSLTHNPVTKEALEIAIVSRGARRHTDVIDCNDTDERSRASMCTAYDATNPIYLRAQGYDKKTAVAMSEANSKIGHLVSVLRGLGWGYGDDVPRDQSPAHAAATAKAITEALEKKTTTAEDSAPPPQPVPAAAAAAAASSEAGSVVLSQILKQLQQDAEKNAELRAAVSKLSETVAKIEPAYVEATGQINKLTQRMDSTLGSLVFQQTAAASAAAAAPPPAAAATPSAAPEQQQAQDASAWSRSQPPPPSHTEMPPPRNKRKAPDDADNDDDEKHESAPKATKHEAEEDAKQAVSSSSSSSSSAEDADLELSDADNKVLQAMETLGKATTTISGDERANIVRIISQQASDRLRLQRELEEVKRAQTEPSANAQEIAKREREKFLALFRQHKSRGHPTPLPEPEAPQQQQQQQRQLQPPAPPANPIYSQALETLGRHLPTATVFEVPERDTLRTAVVDCSHALATQASPMFLVMKDVAKHLSEIEQSLKAPDYSFQAVRFEVDNSIRGAPRVIQRAVRSVSGVRP